MNRKSFTKRTTLNDTLLMSLEIEPKDYRFRVEDKLYLFVKNTGRRYWQVKYKKVNGKWSFNSLGVFPTVNMKQASEMADSFFEQLRKDNFSFEKHIKSRKYKFITLFEAWLERKKRLNWGEGTTRSSVQTIKKNLYSLFGERDFRDITSKEWLTYFEHLYYVQGMPSTMDKLYSFVNSAYKWAAIEYEYKNNPLPNIQGFLPKYKRNEYKFIEIAEVNQFLIYIRAYPNEAISIGLELLLLQFPRHGELRKAKWEEFNLEKNIWIKPAWIMKNGKEHKVFLSRQSVLLLKRLKEIQKTSEYLFPSRHDMNQPMSEGPFYLALEKMGYKDRMNVHGVRYLASTALNNAFSEKSQVIEAALSHVKQGVKGIYDKATHFEESAVLIQWWADYINSCYVRFLNERTQLLEVDDIHTYSKLSH